MHSAMGGEYLDGMLHRRGISKSTGQTGRGTPDQAGCGGNIEGETLAVDGAASYWTSKGEGMW